MKRFSEAISRMRRCDSGSAAVEFAFIGMLLIACSVTVVDFGRAFWLYNKLSYAVEKAARRNLVQPMPDDQIPAEIKKDFPPAGADSTWAAPPQVTVTTGSEFRTVKAVIAMKPVVPIFMGESLSLTLTRRFSKPPAAT